MKAKADRVSPAEIEALAAIAFPRALARYSPYLLLAEPVVKPDGEHLAHIDLSSRTIVLGAKGIAESSLETSLEGLLAHEIGHHVAFPGSPTQAARLLLLERTLLPRLSRSLTTPLYDLLIDERLTSDPRASRSIEPDLCRLLRARAKLAPKDALFTFQRVVLEELWQRPEGDLVGEGREEFDSAFPHNRIEARLVAESLFALAPNLTLQYLYFASIAFRYARATQKEDAEGEGEGGCIEGDIPAEAWAEAVLPSKSEKEAITRAIREGWFSKDLKEKLENQSAAARIAGMPGEGGDGQSALLAEVMATHYRREAERYLFHPPPIRLWSDAIVPTTFEEWEPGDPIHGIDWVATLLQRGETLGAAMPLLRERIADEEGQTDRGWRGKTEIYLDVSGSMPDPKRELNAMTLAAQILATGTTRSGGSVRALLYSDKVEKSFTYCRSEKVMSRFLMRYIGGGTEFPFDVLAESVEEQRAEQPIRVVITDSDFDHNYDRSPENRKIFARAVERSPAFVLLLHRPNRTMVRRYEQAGARVVAVDTLADFPQMAAALAFTLFEGGSDVLPEKLVR